VATATAAVEQNGQKCVQLSFSLKDAQHAQKLNWATRKTNASKRAQYFCVVAILISNNSSRLEILPFVHLQTEPCTLRQKSRQIARTPQLRVAHFRAINVFASASSGRSAPGGQTSVSLA
jgi:hypothetical protein